MNADSHHIAWLNGGWIERFHCFVAQDWVAEVRWSGSSQNEKPTGRYYGSTKGGIARIYDMDSQSWSSTWLH
jgi:hypothetical protein